MLAAVSSICDEFAYIWSDIPINQSVAELKSLLNLNLGQGYRDTLLPQSSHSTIRPNGGKAERWP